MKKILIYFLILLSIKSFGQKNQYINNIDSELFKYVSDYGWVTFQDSLTISPAKIFEQKASSFALGKGYSMKLLKTNTGESGYKHYKFNQYYNGFQIENAVYGIHSKNDRLISGNGEIYTAPNIKSDINITEAEALKACLNKINAKEYYWQNAQREQRLKTKRKDNNATYYPKPEMVFVYELNNNSLILTYKFHIQTIDSGKSNICFVDASTGEVIKQTPLEIFCDPTTVNTNFYGVRAISTNDVAVIGNSYDLEDDCQGSVYGVYDATNSNNIFNMGSNNNNWNVNSKVSSAATSLWSIKQTFNTFNTFLGRNGHDNNGGNLDIYQGVFFTNGGNNNASYNYDPVGDDEIKVGVGDTPDVLDDWNALDILAHEFTHGVTQYEANLTYVGESGALNESFSDIFGEWVESKFRPVDWLEGADRKQGGVSSPIRSLINPLTFNQPDTYLGTKWRPTNITCTSGNDFCGVHFNSGVQNQMFYWLSVGGTGWKDGLTCHAATGTGTQWFVGAIGIEDAKRIAYKILIDYLNSGSNYYAARNAWVQAATELFGECSYQAIQTGRAWDAVGISPPNPINNFVCGNYGSSPYYYNKPGVIYISNNCTTNVFANSNNVQFTSGKKIIIKPGFRAYTGSHFKAIVSDCNFASF
jgi:bacillolysin